MAETIDRRMEGKNSTTPHATAAYKRRKKNEAEGMCKECGKVRVSGRKICIGCVKERQKSQVKCHFRKHLAEHGFEKECLDGWIEVIYDFRKILNYAPVQNLLSKHGTYVMSDYDTFLHRLENAFDAAILQ